MRKCELSGQLYEVVRFPRLPEYIIHDPIAKTSRIVEKSYPALIAMFWPDGRPCTHAELYLLDRSLRLTLREVDGGSLKVYAGHISHLVRYCWRIKKQFWELSTDDFHGFAETLRTEEDARNPAHPRRNGTTVRKALNTAIEFLDWLQTEIFFDKRIIGVRGEDPNIVLVKRKGKLVYPFQPPIATPDPKRPMPRLVRNRLWEAIACLADPNSVNPSLAAQFSDRTDLLAHLDYLRHRRELTLLLLEATGARPGELAKMSANANENCVETGVLQIPTLKRRKKWRDPTRYVPIERGVAIAVELFIHKYRKALLRRMRSSQPAVQPDDALLLSAKDGAPINVRAITKDYQRIVEAAGIKQSACMSMFRHRFITNMVVLHLLEFVRKRPGISREIVTDSDYLTILAKIKPLTGHGQASSLLHYVDWAWDEIGVFDYIRPAQQLSQSVEMSVAFLTSLVSDLKTTPSLSGEQALQAAVNNLQSLRSRINDAIVACETNNLVDLPQH